MISVSPRKWLVFILWLALIPVASAAPAAREAPDNSAEFGPYRVYYSVFNSQFVPAEVAQVHNLVRGSNQALVNIAVQDTRSGRTVPAEISGVARNLIQQSKPLTFKPIEEPDAAYAIASLRHTNEEVFHFDLSIQPEGEASPFNLTFTRKLYTE